MNHARFLPALLLASAACRSTPPERPDLEVVREWLCGSFSSQAQAQASGGEFLDIRLRVVPIWTTRDDGPWLYVEQASATKLDKPYRQRVYRLRAAGGAVVSEVHAFAAEPLRWAGQWKDPWAFDAITPADLVERAGCAVVLRRVAEDAFLGATLDKDCPSELSGATWASSEVRLEAIGMSSWDRGYDAEGKQVWGSTKGPYLFERLP
jgi:hypothetical protein